MMNVIDIWMDFNVMSVKILLYATRWEFITHTQLTKNWAIHMGYRQTGAVYTRRSSLLDFHPDWTPIRSRF